jgi:metal-sulfur cluster biosynthetic enzyme
MSDEGIADESWKKMLDLIRSISDPEHPLSLEQLAVVSAAQVTVSHKTLDPNGGKSSGRDHVLVEFTPTIPHCSMATLIGESIYYHRCRTISSN